MRFTYGSSLRPDDVGVDVDSVVVVVVAVMFVADVADFAPSGGYTHSTE
jgi:hypothetical protein